MLTHCRRLTCYICSTGAVLASGPYLQYYGSLVYAEGRAIGHTLPKLAGRKRALWHTSLLGGWITSVRKTAPTVWRLRFGIAFTVVILLVPLLVHSQTGEAQSSRERVTARAADASPAGKELLAQPESVVVGEWPISVCAQTSFEEMPAYLDQMGAYQDHEQERVDEEFRVAPYMEGPGPLFVTV